MLDHKESLSKYKKTEIISSIFSDDSAMRLDINYKKKTHKHMEVTQYATNHPMDH